jgi:metal-responsive CopG/Arc/MetJ family transcriptional regulator
MKRFTINVQDDLHKRFKIACIQEGKEMTEVIMAYIKDFVEKTEKKSKK